jgi:hypothetical protein
MTWAALVFRALPHAACTLATLEITPVFMLLCKAECTNEQT